MFIFTADYSTQSLHWKWGQDAPDDMVKCKILSAHIVLICEKRLDLMNMLLSKYAQIDRQLQEKGKIQTDKTTVYSGNWQMDPKVSYLTWDGTTTTTV